MISLALRVKVAKILNKEWTNQKKKFSSEMIVYIGLLIKTGMNTM